MRFYNEELLINLMDVSITNVAWVGVFAFQQKENDGPQGPFFLTRDQSTGVCFLGMISVPEF